MTTTTLAELDAARRQEDLDDLLIRWHNWASAERIAVGYNDRAPVTGQYRTSRQYDDINGALDDDIDADRCKVVQFNVEHLQPTHRLAIYLLARNLTTGFSVWNSPRLPQDEAERSRVVSEARLALIERLISAGLIE